MYLNKLMHYKRIIIMVSVSFISFTGCSNKREYLNNSIDRYLKEKRSNYYSLVEYKRRSHIIKDYLKKKNPSIKIKKGVLIKKGDKLKDIINTLIIHSDRNYKYLFNDEYNYSFKDNIDIEFKNIEDFKDYINFSNFPFKITIDKKYKYKKIIIKKDNILKNRLQKLKVRIFYKINPLEAIKEIVEYSNSFLEIDEVANKKLNQLTDIIFIGNAKEFLETLSIKYNLFIDIDKNKISIKKYKTKIFKIIITPLMVKAIANTNLKTDNSGLEQQSNINFGYKIYKELENNIKALLKKDKYSAYFLNRANGLLTIKADKEKLKTIEEIVKDFNDNYSKQIEIKLDIIEIALNKENQNGIDLKLVRKDGRLNFTTPFTTYQSNTLTYQSKSGNLDTLIKILNKFGKVYVSSKPTITTLNTIPTTLEANELKEYVSSVEATTNTTTNVVTYSPKKDTARSGIRIFVYPKIVKDNKILLTISPNLSTLADLEVDNYGDTTIKSKTIKQKSFTSTLLIKNNETILMAGLITTYKKTQKQGMPWISEKKDDKWSDYIGGEVYKNFYKNELLLVITAKIKDLR